MASYGHETGTVDATVTATRAVKRYACIAGGSGGTVTITSKGEAAQAAITVPANQPWSDEFTTLPADVDQSGLPIGSTIVFAGMTSWFVRYL